MIFQKIVPDLCGPCGYAVLGYALIRVSRRPRPWVLAAAAGGCVLLVWGGSVLWARHTGAPFALLCGEYTLPTAAEAVCIFLLFRSLKVPEGGRAAKLLPAAAADTLGIYLIHPFLISVLEEFGVTTGSFCAWISVPLLTLGIFLLSAAAAALLRRIPAVGKWIV
jgi:surface polysaccharide O-acyltransferase-like enzyme